MGLLREEMLEFTTGKVSHKKNKEEKKNLNKRRIQLQEFVDGKVHNKGKEI